MKLFLYSHNQDGYLSANGITCGIVIADSIEEAEIMLRMSSEECNLHEIPFEKGEYFIDSYYAL